MEVSNDFFVIGDSSLQDDVGSSLLSLLADDNTPILRAQLEAASKQTLLTPSTGHIADRNAEREAKYQRTVKATNKWAPVVSRLAHKEQQVFGDAKRVECSVGDLVGSFRPMGDFEADLVLALRNNLASGETGDSKDSERKLVKANPAIEEAALAAKRARIRQLLRYEQQRNIRVKKIKSKAYRQIARKNRMLETARLLEVLDEEDPDLAASIRAQFEEKRASLRMLVKDSARKKWSKLAQRFGGKEGAKAADREIQVARDERAAVEKITKIMPKFNEDSSEESEDEPLLIEEEKQEGGIMGMRFMQEAIRKRRLETSDEAVNEQLSRVEKKVAKLTKTDSYVDNTAVTKKKRRAPTEEEIAKAAENLAQGDSVLAQLAARHVEAESAKKKAKVEKEQQKEALGLLEDDDDDSETDYEEAAPVTRKGAGVRAGKTARKAAPQATSQAASQAAPQAQTESHMPPQTARPTAKPSGRPQVHPPTGAPAGFTPSRHHMTALDLKESVTSLLEQLENEEALVEAVKKQESLIRNAFEDEAVSELRRLEEEENLAEAEAEAEAATKSGKLPGWDGGWVTDKKPLKVVEVKKALNPKRVFVSKKIDKKVNSVLQSELSKRQQFGYANKEHVSMEQAQPLGAEWNTAAVHKRLIQPAVAIRAGTVIQPLQYRKHMGDVELDSLLDSWTSKRKQLTKTRL